MAKLNFFADVETLNCLLGIEFENGDQSVDLTLDLIELPYWFSFTSDEKTQTMKVYQQMDLYNKNETMAIESGSLVLDRSTGKADVHTPREISENIPAFFCCLPQSVGFCKEE